MRTRRLLPRTSRLGSCLLCAHGLERAELVPLICHYGIVEQNAILISDDLRTRQRSNGLPWFVHHERQSARRAIIIMPFVSVEVWSSCGAPHDAGAVGSKQGFQLENHDPSPLQLMMMIISDYENV